MSNRIALTASIVTASDASGINSSWEAESNMNSSAMIMRRICFRRSMSSMNRCVTGYDENIQSAIGHLLCSFALRTRDPEGWMANMFIKAFRTMKSRCFEEKEEL